MTNKETIQNIAKKIKKNGRNYAAKPHLRNKFIKLLFKCSEIIECIDNNDNNNKKDGNESYLLENLFRENDFIETPMLAEDFSRLSELANDLIPRLSRVIDWKVSESALIENLRAIEESCDDDNERRIVADCIALIEDNYPKITHPILNG